MNRSLFFKLIYILAGCFVLYLAWWIQASVVVNSDVAWLVTASGRLWDGGSYAENFFENNPPWILYFYFPIQALMRIFSISLAWALDIYVLICIALSMGLLNVIFRHALPSSIKKWRPFYLFLILIIESLITICDFGQREHFYFILTLPFIMMMGWRIKGGEIDYRLSSCVALLASCGLLFKPYFYLLPATLFCYLVYLRGFREIKKSEWVWIALVPCCYLTYIVFHHPDYFHNVLPIAIRWCYLGKIVPYNKLIFNDTSLYCVVGIVFFSGFLLWSKGREQQFLTPIVLSLFANYGVYFMQREDWIYHIYPAYASVILLYGMTFFIVLNRYKHSAYLFLLTPVCSAIYGIQLGLLNFSFMQNWVTLLSIFVFFLFSVYLSVVYLHQGFNKRAISLSKTALGFVCILLFLFLMKQFGNQYLIGAILVLCFFWIAFHILPYKKPELLPVLAYVGLFSLVGFFPVNLALYYYAKDQLQADLVHEMVKVMRDEMQAKSVYIFSDLMLHHYPGLTLFEVKDASRFSVFWMLPGMLKLDYLKQEGNLKAKREQDFSHLVSMITEDIRREKPDHIFIDSEADKMGLTWVADESLLVPFSFLSSFSKYDNFKKIWQNYQFKTKYSASFLFLKNNSPPYRFHSVEPKLSDFDEQDEMIFYASEDSGLCVSIYKKYFFVQSMCYRSEKMLDMDRQYYQMLIHQCQGVGTASSSELKTAVNQFTEQVKKRHCIVKFDIYEKKND